MARGTGEGRFGEVSGSNHRQGMAPIVGTEPRVLVLGSMPGNVSLSVQRYYAHPRNQFWPIIAELVGARGSYEERSARLAECGIALWDVLDRCQRLGSLDAAIRDEVPNDFATFLGAYASIEAIYFNGGTAAGIWYRRIAAAQSLRAVAGIARLPSTSPAHASMPLREKIEAWRVILDHLAAMHSSSARAPTASPFAPKAERAG